MYKDRNVYAVVLAAGRGSRMGTEKKKQFLSLLGKPVCAYSIMAMAEHPLVDSVIVVTGEEDTAEIKEIIADLGLKRDIAVVTGGRERYHSVYQGLSALQEKASFSSIVLIQDAARPMLTEKLITDSIEGVAAYGAVVAGMPVKDTIKILDDENYTVSTPDRATLWLMQTPQSFAFGLIYAAYCALIRAEETGTLKSAVTDDAQVLECFTDHRVRVIRGSYENIKITTPEDMFIAEHYLMQG